MKETEGVETESGGGRRRTSVFCVCVSKPHAQWD